MYCKCDQPWTIIVFIIIILFGSVINLCSTGFNVAIVWWCPFKYRGYIDVHVNTTNDSLSLQPDKLDVFDDVQKFVFTSAAVSGTLSYFLMILLSV